MDRNISSLDTLRSAAEDVLRRALKARKDAATVLILSGPLGAGKTAFVKEIAHILSVLDTVVSPTFNLMKVYETKDSAWRRLVHIDAYRLRESGEATPLHLEEYLHDPQTLLCVEWGEHIRDALPPTAQTIVFSHEEKGNRSLSYAKV